MNVSSLLITVHSMYLDYTYSSSGMPDDVYYVLQFAAIMLFLHYVVVMESDAGIYVYGAHTYVVTPHNIWDSLPSH